MNLKIHFTGGESLTVKDVESNEYEKFKVFLQRGDRGETFIFPRNPQDCILMRSHITFVEAIKDENKIEYDETDDYVYAD